MHAASFDVSGNVSDLAGLVSCSSGICHDSEETAASNPSEARNSEVVCVCTLFRRAR